MVFVDLYETIFFLWQIMQLLDLISSSHTFSLIDYSGKQLICKHLF